MSLIKTHKTSFKSYDIVKVPTIEVTHLREYNEETLIFLDRPLSVVNDHKTNFVHLHILGDFKPSLYDWVLVASKNGTFNFLAQIDEYNINDATFISQCRPIVATTDSNIGLPLISKKTQKLYVDMNSPTRIDVLVSWVEGDDNKLTYDVLSDEMDGTITAIFKGDIFKIENTFENQLRFNGQYGKINAEVITLKDTSLLTEDELLDIARIIHSNSENIIQEFRSFYLNDFKRKFLSNTINATPRVVDYLRYRGYAWEWMGLSVIEQINYGWVKLILEDEN